MQSQTPPLLSPREPEVEIMGRIARVALVGLRWFLFVAGATMIAAAIWMTMHPTDVMSEAAPIPPLSHRVTHNLVFVCVGLPLLVPVRWLVGRGRWVALGVGAAAWFGPILLGGDLSYGFLLRMFASFVAATTLLVWFTLSSLVAVPDHQR